MGGSENIPIFKPHPKCTRKVVENHGRGYGGYKVKRGVNTAPVRCCKPYWCLAVHHGSFEQFETSATLAGLTAIGPGRARFSVVQHGSAGGAGRSPTVLQTTVNRRQKPPQCDWDFIFT